MRGFMHRTGTGGTTADREGRWKSLRPVPWGTGAGSNVRKKRNQTGNIPLKGEEAVLWRRTVPPGAAQGPGADGNPKELPTDADLSGEDMPEVKSYMKERQKNGEDFDAADIFEETWLWLKERGCEKLVSTQLVRNYAMSVSRWIQCEHAISEYGFLAKHPTTGQAIASPYVSMSQNYMKQVNNLWYQIFQIVKENCSAEFTGATPQDDVMERLLRSRKGM